MASHPFGLSDAQLAEVLTAGCRAPSLHNSQPWRFLVADDRIEVQPDPARLLPVADPDGREMRLAVGAALFNLRVALSVVAGRRVAVEFVRDGAGATAVLTDAGRERPSPEKAMFYQAISRRRTNRRPFFDIEVSSGERLQLVRAAQLEGATLLVMEDAVVRAQIAQLAKLAHRELDADPLWLAEFRFWTGRHGSPDGVPMSSAGPAPAPEDEWVLRDYGPSERQSRPAGKDFEPSPMLGVVATSADGPIAQLLAGQAMERMLLTATDHGMSASFLSQLIERDIYRNRLADLLGTRLHPQAVVRIGYGSPVPVTPRRGYVDCLITEPTASLPASAATTTG